VKAAFYVSAALALTASTLHSADFSALEAKAKRGDAESQFQLARAYLVGDGMEKSPARALELMKRAADQNHSDALAGLGYLYSAGLVVEKDDGRARAYFEKGLASAAAQSNLGLFLIRGRGGNKDVPRGLSLMQQAATAGNTQAAVLLGEIYYTGEHSDGTPDYLKAYEVLLGPANSGNAVAQNTVGVILKDGRVGEMDIDSARVWFEKSALQGNPKACSNLAELWNYQSENHMARIEALRWMLVAGDLSDVQSKQHYGEIKSFLSREEEKIARQLADLTLGVIRK
jgi:TPR repeat protein